MYGSSHNLSGALRRHRGFAGAPAWLCTVVCLVFSSSPRAENAASPPHASVDRSGELRVSNGMTLHLTADLGNVRIETLPPDAPAVVRYAVHIETDVPNPAGQKLLDRYSLATRET